MNQFGEPIWRTNLEKSLEQELEKSLEQELEKSLEQELEQEWGEAGEAGASRRMSIS